MKKQTEKAQVRGISEKTRTIILVALLLLSGLIIWWVQSGINSNFVDTL